MLKNLYSLVRELKRIKRRGWLHRGLEADSIAEHSYGATVLGWYLAEKEGVNANKVIELLVLHDLVMAKMEDVIPQTGKYEQKRDMEEEAKMEVAKLLGPDLGRRYLELFREFNDGETKEAIVAKEADKLETLLQGEAFEEETSRNDVIDKEFIDNYSKYFRTDTGKQIFQEILERKSN